MPVDPSIPLKVESPNPANMISSFLDLGLKKTSLDRQRQTFDADVARAKADSLTSQAGSEVAQANVNPLIQQQAAQTSSAQTGADMARFRLTGEQAQASRQLASALVQDPDFVSGNSEGMIQKLAEARQMMLQSGIPPHMAEANTALLINKAVTDPKSVRQTLANMIQQGMGSGAQAAQSLVPAIAQQQVGGTDVRGNPTVVSRDQFGGVQQQSLPQSAPPGQPAPLSYPAGENTQTYKLLSEEREAARGTLSQAPTIHELNREILDSLKIAETGQYSSIIAKAQSLGGMLGLSLSGGNDLEKAASAYDIIDKYTTQAATRAAQGMGNDTATALNAQLKQNASVERNPTAIKKSIHFNDAVLSGAEAYQAGLERAIQSNPQMDVFTKRKFDQEWAKSFEPVIFQLYNAKKAGDTEQLQELTKSLGSRAPEIMRKAQRLQELSRGM
jgi:hypothetical protein